MADWTDELKQEVIAAYTEQEPTSETSMSIVRELAETFDKTVNGVRVILNKAGVYVKITPATTTKTDAASTTSKRVNKSEAISALKEKIEALGVGVDADIIDRMTGKAAAYFTKLIEDVTPG